MTQSESWIEILRHLNRIGAEVSQGSAGEPGNLEDTLSSLASGARKIAPGFKAIVIPATETPLLVSDKTPFEEQDFFHPKGMAARAFSRKGRVLSYQEDDLPLYPFQAGTEMQIVACYPLIVDQENLGVLYVQHERPTSFSELELAELDNYAILAGMTLAAALRAQQAIQEQARKEKELRR